MEGGRPRPPMGCRERGNRPSSRPSSRQRGGDPSCHPDGHRNRNRDRSRVSIPTPVPIAISIWSRGAAERRPPREAHEGAMARGLARAGDRFCCRCRAAVGYMGDFVGRAVFSQAYNSSCKGAAPSPVSSFSSSSCSSAAARGALRSSNDATSRR